MADFDFKNLGTRSFEHLTQTLCVKYVGPGTTIFGDGPDGGREATFRGKASFPSAAAGWDGYIVIQAKFLQRPADNNRDVEWLCQQLEGELAKFVARDLEHPQYYILSTNVRLSSFSPKRSRKGTPVLSGKDKISNVFKKFSNELDLKSFDVWDYDKLRSFLEDSESIRNTYAAWITPSDVLMSLMGKNNGYEANFEDCAWRIFSGDLRKQQFNKLQQAGHNGEGTVSLSSVFIDLPIDANQGAVENLAVSYLLDQADAPHDPKSIFDRKEASIRFENKDPPPANRFLVLGGPGQGKSTITQFIAQVLRARWLISQPEYRFADGTYNIMKGIISSAEREGISISGAARFPVRIDLPSFADCITNTNDNISLFEYIRTTLQDSAGSNPISSTDLKLWLSKHPWFLMLDGLDEVPPSANRATVLERIDEFWDEVSSVNADVFMVIMSRPQGYNDDLNPKRYQSIRLKSLEPDRALNLAQLFSEALVEDVQDRNRVMSTMRASSENKTTMRLLVSPLQVAIMLKLVESRGEAPNDKWQLFNGYYQVISNREKTKGDAVSKIIRERGRDIDIIHQVAGLVLQVESEVSGGSEATIAKEKFSRLVDKYYIESETEPKIAHSLTASIIEASVQRLVFLNGKIHDHISFDVRSLQEYMAAACLMSGDPADIQNRLRIIADKSHWQHVFQIAASKAFSAPDAQHIRDTIVTICGELNQSEEACDTTIFAGSRLAQVLLEDGIAYDQPKYMRALAKVVSEGISLGEMFITSGLVDIACRPELEKTFLDAVNATISFPDTTSAHGGWALITELCNRGVSWALELASQHWPSDEGARSTIISRAAPSAWDGSTLDHLDDTIEQISANQLMEIFSDRNAHTRNHQDLFLRYPFLARILNIRSMRGAQHQFLSPDSPLSAECVLLTSTNDDRSDGNKFPDRGTLRSFGIFDAIFSNPTELSIREGFEKLKTLPEKDVNDAIHYAPWPIRVAWEQLHGLVEPDIDTDVLDISVWMPFERTKSTDRYGVDRLEIWKSGKFINKIGGAPRPSSMWLSTNSDTISPIHVDHLIDLERQTPISDVKAYLGLCIAFFLTRKAPTIKLEANDLRYLERTKYNGLFHLGALSAFPLEVLTSATGIEKLREILHERQMLIRLGGDVEANLLGEIFDKYPGDNMLLPLLCSAAFNKIDYYENLCDKIQILPTELTQNPYLDESAAILSLIKGNGLSVRDATIAMCGRNSLGIALRLLIKMIQSDSPSTYAVEISKSILRNDTRQYDDLAHQLYSSLNNVKARQISNINIRKTWESLNLPNFALDVVLEE